MKNAIVEFKLRFSFVSLPNLDLKPSEDVELSVEEVRIERFKKGGV